MIPLDEWIEENAKKLEKQIKIHLEIYGLGSEDLEGCTRMIMTSVRQRDLE